MSKPEAAIIISINLLAVVALFLPPTWAGAGVEILAIFVVPGFLMTRLLFDERTSIESVTRFILALSFGVFLAFSEAFGLILLGFELSQTNLVLLGVSVSGSMFLVHFLRSRAKSAFPPGTSGSSLPVLVLALLTIPVLALFGLLHRSVLREQYVEFYFDPQSFDPDPTGVPRFLALGEVGVNVIVHGSSSESFLVGCEDPRGQLTVLTTIQAFPDQTVHLDLAYDRAQATTAPGKTTVGLYHSDDLSPYRSLSLPGIPCDSLTLIDRPVR